LLLALGVVGVVAGAGLPGFAYAPQAIEASVFATTVASAALIIQVTFGRAPTLRDAEL
jgi:type II secretory pathway pseudopilin PulG